MNVRTEIPKFLLNPLKPSVRYTERCVKVHVPYLIRGPGVKRLRNSNIFVY